MVDPVNPSSGNPNIQPASKQPAAFDSGENKVFLGMNFTPEEWKELMDVMVRNLSEYMNARMKRALERMKEDWRRERNED